jgi:hypothetical protein
MLPVVVIAAIADIFAVIKTVDLLRHSALGTGSKGGVLAVLQCENPPVILPTWEAEMRRIEF